ncbi:hypothetical protein ABBQ38_005013 [Trebouxia sp. C0009 RCD-2024]
MLAQGGGCCLFASQKLPKVLVIRIPLPSTAHSAAQDSIIVSYLLGAEPQPAAEDSHDDDESIFKDSDKPKEGPLKVYFDGRKSGLYRPDPRQETTIKLLQQLYDELKKLHVDHKRPSGLTTTDHIGADNRPRHSWFTRLMTGAPTKAQQTKLQGLYMHGGVGVGKTMLMDLLAHCAPSAFQLKRTHFHDFMLDVHSSLKKYHSSQDPLVQVADAVARESKVLCLDEFFVNDVADAAILNRLFSRFWENGLVLVSTSNRGPDALYEGGLQRDLFLPFIEKLKTACKVHNMESVTDYRRLAHHHRGLFFTDERKEEELQARFNEVAQPHRTRPCRVDVIMGRTLDVAQAGGPVCFFTFDKLCNANVGAADYIALAKKFHTIALSGVPVFTADIRSQAYRFVTLIDVLYERHIRLFCSADGEPSDLFANIMTMQDARKAKSKMSKEQEEALVVDDNLGFAKDRTISRLLEMQSREYLIVHAEHHAPELVLALKEANKHSEPAISV